jgi:hypothetical protein
VGRGTDVIASVGLRCNLIVGGFQRNRRVQTGLYVAALVALCHAQSEEPQCFCIEILDAQTIPPDSLELIQSFKEQSVLEKLFKLSVSNNLRVAPIAALHFELLVAAIISSSQISLESRQQVLRPLIDLDECARLESSIADSSQPSMTEMYAHLQQARSTEPSLETNLRTMQFVVDFCHVRQTQTASSLALSTHDSDGKGWYEKLQELKKSGRPVARTAEQPRATIAANPCWPQRGQESEAPMQVSALLE